MNNTVQSRIVNVIETSQGDEIKYFTLEGLLIGGFKGGARIEPEPVQPRIEKPNGQIVKPPTPQDVQRAKDKEAEGLQTADGRLKHLKKDVA